MRVPKGVTLHSSTEQGEWEATLANGLRCGMRRATPWELWWESFDGRRSVSVSGRYSLSRANQLLSQKVYA